MVPLDRALVSSYRLSIVTMSLTAAVWPQFAMQVLRGGIGRFTCIGSYVNKQVTTFTFWAQATTCSKHHTWTVMDAGCECAPWVRSANPSDSWALVWLARRWNDHTQAQQWAILSTPSLMLSPLFKPNHALSTLSTFTFLVALQSAVTQQPLLSRSLYLSSFIAGSKLDIRYVYVLFMSGVERF